MTGEYRIPAPRQRVWDALNDVEVLRQCIPGCESVEQLSDVEIKTAVTARVGPVKAKFTGTVTLSDRHPPNSYRIAGEGKGGTAGFAKGEAVVTLAEDGGDTVLTYTVSATVGGKLAQIGSRLIDGAARKMADEFFAAFAAIAGGEAAAAEEVAPEIPEKAPGLSPWVWIPGLIALVGLSLYFFGVAN